MSQRALTLPLRTRLPRPQWICQRCMTTQTETAAAPFSAAPPPITPNEEKAARRPDPFLRQKLPHRIPTQYLQHSISDDLNAEEKEHRAGVENHKGIHGVVVSAGLMDKTVRVRVPGKRWNQKIGKYYASYTQHLVHDPKNSLIVGDVIQLHRLKVSKQIHHVVGSIIAPFGKPIDQRPHIPTPDERLSQYKEKRFAKLERRSLRRKAAAGDEKAINELKAMGLDPGKNAAPGKGLKAGVQKGVGKKRDPTSGAILGNKGQKLPEGVLPGGKHEVGKIDERAKHNREGAMKLKEKTEENLAEAKEKADALHEQGLSAEDDLPRKSHVPESRGQ